MIKTNDHSKVYDFRPGGAVLWKPSIPIRDVSSLLSYSKRLMIKCKIHVARSTKENKDLLPLHHLLGSDLEAMFRSGSLSDVVLVVEGREIPAHRVILASRSTVFRAMFEHNTIESKEGRVDITDCTTEAILAMVNFMYSDAAPQFDDATFSSSELLMVAEKYDVQGLKRVCEQELLTKMDFKTAARTLQVAHDHNAQLLKQLTLEYISGNLDKVMATDKWKEVTRSRQDLMQLVLNLAAEYMKTLT